MSIQSPATDVVRAEAAAAERRRRSRLVASRLTRYGPFLAAALLLFAVAARLAGLSASVPLTAIAIVLFGVIAYAVMARRSPVLTDALASRLDDDAGLHGELRSAHWFATHGEGNPWSHFHLDRAAEMLRGVEWSRFYPPVRSTTAWVATAALVAAAVAATIRVSPHPGVVAAVGRGPEAHPAGGPLTTLPPELQKQLEALLAASQGKALSPEDAKKLAELTDKLLKSGTITDASLAEMLKRMQEAAKEKGGAPTIADDANENAAAGNINDMKEMLKNLEERLGKAHQGDKASGTGDPTAADSGKGEIAKASASQGDANQAAGAEMSMRMTREAASDPGGQMMMQGGGPMGGDPMGGAGNSGARGRGDAKGLLAEALRRELIEANADTAGANVSTEDIRRKTEQGRSTLGFTNAVPRGPYARGRAVPPPPVPDGRRALVQSYFIKR